MPAPAPSALDRAAGSVERWVTLVLRGRTDPGEPWRPVRLALVWLITRLLVLLAIPLVPTVVGDVNYFAKVTTLGPGPGYGTLSEYPLPAVWLLRVPAVLSGHDEAAYGIWFVGLMLLVDGLLLLALQRLCDRPEAVTAWLAAGLAIGPLLIVRFDLVTGAAVAVALLVVVRRPRAAAVAMVAAAGIKLWPAVLVGAVGAAAGRRKAYAVAAVVASVILVAAALVLEPWDRLLTPLTYQTGRGLQIESLVAYPFMVLLSLGADGYHVAFGAALSYEVSGPGTAAAAQLSTVAMAAAVAWALWGTALLWRRRSEASLVVPAAWVVLSSMCLLVLSNKVFSPQYLAWLVPVGVAVLAVTGERLARTCAWLLILAALAAQLSYPWLHEALLDPRAGAAHVLAMLTLLARLVLVGVVAWLAVRRTWAWSRSAS